MIGEPTNFQHISHGGDPDVCGGGESEGPLTNQLILVDLAQKQRAIEEAKMLNCTSAEASLPTPQAVTEDAIRSRQPGAQDAPERDDSAWQQQQQQQEQDAHDGPHSPHKEASESHSLPLPPTAGVEKSQKPSRSLRLKKKKKIRNDMISLPYNFQHVSHAGFDRDNNFSQFNIEKQVEDQIRELFKEIGLTKTQMSRPRTREFVYNLLERHGVFQEARRESQLLTSQKRLSGQTAEVVSGGGQPGMGLGNEESGKGVSQVREGPDYTGTGHEDEVMLVASLDLSDVVQSSPQRAAPQDQSQEPVKKYRHRAAKRQAPRPPSQVGDAGPVAPPEKVIQTAASDLRVSRVCPDAASGGEAPYNPALDKKVIHCIVSEGPVVHTVTSYVISSASSAGETQGGSSTSPQDNNSSVISIERAPTPPPPRKSLPP
ncbi:uncharacterized protein LOC125035433 isoform X3 [Penaeus chinensis]|uniref:uncharacterized protein LOC125035433 isoform X3 n=1 Tax=Penaeus chinensis TaxID=139456 RepID=UPI001FB570DC|nr:uncharacterized protein LOC125035433 isoform X3 [Penaeus chinensis]